MAKHTHTHTHTNPAARGARGAQSPRCYTGGGTETKLCEQLNGPATPWRAAAARWPVVNVVSMSSVSGDFQHSRRMRRGASTLKTTLVAPMCKCLLWIG